MALAIVDDTLYIAEARTARIRRAPLAGGKSEVVLSSEVGKVDALAPDGHSGLLALDVIGRRLLRIDPKELAITLVADGLPVRYGVVGSGARLRLGRALRADARHGRRRRLPRHRRPRRDRAEAGPVARRGALPDKDGVLVRAVRDPVIAARVRSWYQHWIDDEPLLAPIHLARHPAFAKGRKK